VSTFVKAMEQVKKYSDTVDHDNYPEVVPEVLPEIYQEAPEVYKEAPEPYSDAHLPEIVPEPHSTLQPIIPGKRPRWWKRHRKWTLVCGLILVLVIVGGAVGGSVGATNHKCV
jgi:hypothetical protein